MPENIREQIAILVELQKIDMECNRLKARLREVPAQISELQRGAEEYTGLIEDKKNTIDELKKQYRSCESEVQGNLGMIAKSQEKLRVVKTNKEYQSSLKEIDDLKLKNTAIEDRMLEFLEQIEAVEKQLEETGQQHAELADEARQQKKQIEQEAEKIRATLLRLEAERKTICSGLDSSLLETFNRVQAAHSDWVAIVEVRNSVCQGCHLNIPPQLYNELHRCDSLKYCPNCERIIYWQEQDERSE
jgi:predicted  nucleic acid-binding Zn-ribbon protein